MPTPTTIGRLSVETLDIPLHTPFSIAGGTQHVAQNLLVTVELADGTRGYGEAAPFPAYNSETQELARAAIEAARTTVEDADVRAVIAQESGFRPCAVSKKGAKGLMQLMPATAEQFSVAEPFDAEANVAAGTKYLRQLLEKYKGDLRLTLAAYNSGPGAVDAAGGVPDLAETKGYVDAIAGVMGVKQIELPALPPSHAILLDAIHP